MFVKLMKPSPVSDDIDEIFFNANEKVARFHFEDFEYDEYCGIFGGGFGVYSCAAHINELAFLISHGQGYLFDINKRNLIVETEDDQLSDLIVATSAGGFVTCNQFELYFYGSDRVWRSNRVSSDGIKLDSVSDSLVSGRVYNFERWVPFKLDLVTFDYFCEWKCPVP